MSRWRLPGIGAWNTDPAWAHVYDWLVEHPAVGGPAWRLGLGAHLDRLYAATGEIGRQPAGSTILDLPCGGGVALRGLRRGQGVRYVAADISQQMLARTTDAARERGVLAQVETQIQDVHALTHPDGEFDLVVSFTGIHCFPAPHRAVLELGRVVAPGGRLIGSTLLLGSGLRVLPVFAVGRAIKVLGPGCTADQLAGWLAEAGLVDVRVETDGAMGWFSARRD